MFVNQNMVKIMRQNYEYLARIFCRRIRRRWLWNYPWALEFVWEDHAQPEERKYIVWFLKIIRSLVSTKLQRAEGYEEVGMILRGCACNKTTHTTILYQCTSGSTQTHQTEHGWYIYEICTYNYCTEANLHSIYTRSMTTSDNSIHTWSAV